MKNRLKFLYLLIIFLSPVSSSLNGQYLVMISDNAHQEQPFRTKNISGKNLAVIEDKTFLDEKGIRYQVLDTDALMFSYYWLEWHPASRFNLSDFSGNDLRFIWFENHQAIAKVFNEKVFQSFPPDVFYRKIDFLQKPAQINGYDNFQNPKSEDMELYFAIYDSIRIDSLLSTVRHLSGDEPFFLDGQWDSIMTRYARTEEIQKAENYLFHQLNQFGYDVELQQFYIDTYFGPIIFAPDNRDFGWVFVNNQIFSTGNGGESWSKLSDIEFQHPIRQLFAVNHETVYGVGYYGLIIKTTDGGRSWNILSPPESIFFYDTFFINEQVGWICGERGKIFYTSNGGDSWEQQSTPTNNGLYRIFFTSEVNGWAVGSANTILYTNDGGQNWQQQTSENYVTFAGVCFKNSQEGFILGTKGTLLRTINGGQTWERIDLPVANILWDINFFDDQFGVIVGSFGTVLITNDGGDSWDLLPNAPFRHYYHVSVPTDSAIWVSAIDDFFLCESNGIDWHSQVSHFVDRFLNNIIATKQGTTYPDKIYILSGHYDSISGNQTRETRAPGADDNASGTAVVLEAARVLFPYQFKHTIKFVLFSAEEVGLVGSGYFAREAYSHDKDILGVVNLDMLAFDSNSDRIFEIHARDVANSQSLGSFLKTNVYDWAPSLSPEYIPTEGTSRSDHASFWEYGYSGILLIEDFDNFNPDYHSIYDLIDNFDQSYYLNLGLLSIVSIAQLAEMDTASTLVRDEVIFSPESFSLDNPYPNPFNQTTSISFRLSQKKQVNLSVYNLSGQLVGNLINDFLEPGNYTIRWNSHQATSGIYIIKLESGVFSLSKKCVLLK